MSKDDPLEPAAALDDDQALRFPTRGERMAMRGPGPKGEVRAAFAYPRGVSSDEFPGAVMEVVMLIDGTCYAVPVFPGELRQWLVELTKAMP